MERSAIFDLHSPGILFWKNCRGKNLFRVEAHGLTYSEGASVFARTSNHGMSEKQAIKVAGIYFDTFGKKAPIQVHILPIEVPLERQSGCGFSNRQPFRVGYVPFSSGTCRRITLEAMPS